MYAMRFRPLCLVSCHLKENNGLGAQLRQPWSAACLFVNYVFVERPPSQETEFSVVSPLEMKQGEKYNPDSFRGENYAPYGVAMPSRSSL